ncbi:MAG: glycosyltransferase family 9 protein [Verrucomicrobiales bacterium]|nr:glycosyltransferase family 9 protein [Verrucomicrobiales bacterium]
MKLSGNERILVLKPSSLGDIVHTLPAVSAIHRAFPETTIDWLVNTEWSPLLEGVSFLNHVIPFPRRELRGLGGLFRAGKWAKNQLASRDYDLALDFQGLLRSSLLGKLSGAKRRFGFSSAREGAPCLYHEAICVQNWKTTHAVDRNRQLVEALGIETSPVEFPLPSGDPVAIPEEFQERPLLLHPFSRGRGKSLSPVEVSELCEQVAPHPVWLVGVAGDEANHEWPENVLNLLNQTTLPQLIHLLRKAAWSISVDSGPMHLAAAISDRVLSIHTWSDPKMVGPWRPEALIWRDSHILPVRELKDKMFPERRDLRDAFAAKDRLLEKKDIAAIAEITREKLTP